MYTFCSQYCNILNEQIDNKITAEHAHVLSPITMLHTV